MQRHVFRFGSIIVILGMACLSGCRSIEGRYVDPQAVTHGECIGGVPVVVDRPRWLKVTVKEVTYLMFVQDTSTVSEAAVTGALDAPGDAGKPPKTANPAAAKKTEHSVMKREGETFTRTIIDTEVISIGEVYAIDLLRPFSGSSDHTLEMMDDKGHLKSVHNQVDDSTLKDVLSNLDNIKSFIGFAGDKPPVSRPGFEIVALGESVSKVLIYDIYDLMRGRHQPILVIPTADPCAPPCTNPCGQ